ncbi:MAG: chemotaxis response regulator protein-glutamate methylesterase [Euryarchaeota archaeon]|nr:chemotaxis response regulator protein-glutamate methylesterase [Euryarchaeota archaeon]MBU4223034.1 chemotaxis response regulator protein-glutamate methylesterase [Euryarchaeota archaeon]MCG2735825.1 chemotaxis response regulator protein-glutamate methylesterase [Candidatus Methanoperedenaceae archaeon]
MSRIKVLVVDDSALMRKIITEMLVSAPEIEVIGKAYNGKDAIEKVSRLKPDVIIMEIELSVLDGLQALGYIMSECPTPVIILSTENSADMTITAFQYGAVDFLQKPSGSISLDITSFKDELIKKVKAAAGVKTANPGFIKKVKLQEKLEPEMVKNERSRKIVVIGTSTGGPRALQQVIPLLPQTLDAAVLVVQHMPQGFTKSLADRLDKQSLIKVREAKEGDHVEPGTILVAPGDYHMIVKQQKINGKTVEVISLNRDEKVNGVRPSLDVLLNSVAQIYRKDALAVILTGMGSDGSKGIRKIKQAGGKVIAEDESTCVIYGMPRAIIEQELADYILPINLIAEGIVQNT